MNVYPILPTLTRLIGFLCPSLLATQIIIATQTYCYRLQFPNSLKTSWSKFWSIQSDFSNHITVFLRLFSWFSLLPAIFVCSFSLYSLSNSSCSSSSFLLSLLPSLASLPGAPSVRAPLIKIQTSHAFMFPARRATVSRAWSSSPFFVSCSTAYISSVSISNTRPTQKKPLASHI